MMLTQLRQGLSDFSTHVVFLLFSFLPCPLHNKVIELMPYIYSLYLSIGKLCFPSKNRISTYIIGFLLQRRLLFISSYICIKIDTQIFILYFRLKFKTSKIYLVIIPALAIGHLSIISRATLTITRQCGSMHASMCVSAIHVHLVHFQHANQAISNLLTHTPVINNFISGTGFLQSSLPLVLQTLIFCKITQVSTYSLDPFSEVFPGFPGGSD